MTLSSPLTAKQGFRNCSPKAAATSSGGSGVGSVENNIRTTFLKGNHQVRSFGGDVQTAGKRMPLGFFLLKALADGTKYGHLAFRPINDGGVRLLPVEYP